MNGKREFLFTDENFELVRTLVAEHAGIALSDVKRDMVYSRLVRRVRALKFGSFDEYCQFLQSEGEGGGEEELMHFINALTTNLTYFFREPHHFTLLAERILPVIQQRNSQVKKLRIWSAGCSTGMEPYSIAMVLKEQQHLFPQWDIKILATDLDTNVLETARQGIYDEDKLSGISSERLQKWFKKGKNKNKGKVKIASELKALITFKHLNLFKEWPFNNQFDVVFCRNVIIYFNKDMQRKLFKNFERIVAEKGYMIIGHSETLYNVSESFKLLGRTVYQKNK